MLHMVDGEFRVAIKSRCFFYNMILCIYTLILFCFF